MGVLNVTPDSFSDGGLFYYRAKALEKSLAMADEGADIIDVGGESTRPGSEPVSAEKEKDRVIPVISRLRKKTNVLISIDTTKTEVAKAALDEGADILNDISACRFDPSIISLVAQRKVPVILMHMKGTPKTMQTNPYYENIFSEIKEFFEERISTVLSHGISKKSILVDPGIGFGKRFQDNLDLIQNLQFLNELNCPIMVGTSRKSFLGQILNLPPQERVEGTIASSILSILHGAHILRVHDVRAVKRAIQVAEAIINHRSGSGPLNSKLKGDYAS
ncbi:dihydropteroate synthase [bacterium]|nr:dihydropteroate synthase [bacterium]